MLHLESAKVKESARSQRGANLVEYVLLIMLIAIIAIAGVKAFGNSLSDSYSNIASAVLDANTQH